MKRRSFMKIFGMGVASGPSLVKAIVAAEAPAKVAAFAGADMVYIPHIYAKEILTKFYGKTIAPGLVNGRYGSYKKQITSVGDTVMIKVKPEIKAGNYRK